MHKQMKHALRFVYGDTWYGMLWNMLLLLLPQMEMNLQLNNRGLQGGRVSGIVRGSCGICFFFWVTKLVIEGLVWHIK